MNGLSGLHKIKKFNEFLSRSEERKKSNKSKQSSNFKSKKKAGKM